jgi:hypothetical protein
MSTIDRNLCRDAVARNPKRMESAVDNILFNLFCDLYGGGRPSGEAAALIEGMLPSSWSFFIIRDGNPVWSAGSTPLAPNEIRDMIPPENIGIFTCQISGRKRPHDSRGLLSAACLGEDKNGCMLAAGLIAPGRRYAVTEDDHEIGRLLARIRRCYCDGAASRTLCSFIKKTGAFRYAVDSATHEIITRRLPEGRDTEADAELLDRRFVEELLPRILEHDSTIGSRLEEDARISNLSIARSRVLNHEYILLTFMMEPTSVGPTGEVAKLISDFTHMARGKLGAIQTAARQLALEKGRVIDDDDIALASIIQSSVAGLNAMLGNLEQYEYRKAAVTTPAGPLETAARPAEDSRELVEVVRNSSGVA